jgi:hypothetical protein
MCPEPEVNRTREQGALIRRYKPQLVLDPFEVSDFHPLSENVRWRISLTSIQNENRED